MSGRELGVEQRALLDAVLARLLPSDESGPGARESGTLGHVEHALVALGELERDLWARGLAWLAAAARAQSGARFELLSAARQDALLAQAERDPRTNGFFELVRRLAIEAFFGETIPGGGSAGWDLIGYPGPRRAWSAREQQLDELPGPWA